ncbi:hypothetical protein C2S53_005091 [Perilla frutescens var. hirtella]|uniref:PGG domain-containing protein n=1 Tax=Perilla frutescens var. hirtella TaxID=608512 RepID=A0AAD4P3N5_PERFH|nr:hypothetical protein C2S53_005091 [Perilla frutescens var. hirtella]
MVEAVTSMKICESECDCCIDKIYSSMEKDAKVWKEVDEMRVATTPLHGAAAAGKTAVAVEIMNLMPSMGRKLNGKGQSPLHVAIEAGKRETAATLARLDKQLVRVKGKGGLTPLMHCVSSHNDLELLAQLLLACPESVTDVNNSRQTVVYIALGSGNCKAACVLVDWLRRRDQISSVLTLKDDDGNTALHAAAQFGCVKGAEKIVGLMKLNRVNSSGKTALDIAIDYGQKEVEQVLRHKGAKRSHDITPATNKTEYVLSPQTSAEAVARAYYYLTRDLTLEIRGAILVVATLIVAATYQGVHQPPGGIYPPEEDTTTRRLLITSPYQYQYQYYRRLAEVRRPHQPGQMVMSKNRYRYFMPSNTFAFVLSAVIIIFVVPGTPIFLILHLCLVFMCISYLLALETISYYTGISHMIYFMALYTIVGAFLVKLLYYPFKALLVDEDWWLRRLSVKFDNFSRKFRGRYAAATMTTGDRIKKQHQILNLK